MNEADADLRPAAGVAERSLEAWIESSTAEELRAGAIYLQLDARWLYASSAKYRDTPGQEWIAARVQPNAAHSAKFARAAAERVRAIDGEHPVEFVQCSDRPEFTPHQVKP